MKNITYTIAGVMISLLLASVTNAQSQIPTSKAPRVEVASGVIQGINDSGVFIFKGIPFAQPPVGDLRWKPPQPPKDWENVLKTTQFGNRCMQHPFGDMRFRSPKMSEDCLYLNVWTPVKLSKMDKKELPVLVYFYGGGLQSGDGSEYRYDGEHLARTEEMIVVTANYRVGIFGFLAHPALTEESPHHASGNYGFLDQVQALRWVQQNIAAFGGDPDKVTIAGESAGSMSVSALMASPLSNGLFRSAVGESGGLFGPLTPAPRSKAEQQGVKFATKVGAESVDELRKMSASKLLQATQKFRGLRFGATIDGYFLPQSPQDIFEAGKQAQVPLLLGWNAEEMSGQVFLRGKEPTPSNFIEAVNRRFGDDADKVLQLFSHKTHKQVQESATQLAGYGFTVYGTWKWAKLHSKTGESPVYRYYYTRERVAKSSYPADIYPTSSGAVHSAEIEYIMGNLSTNPAYDWRPGDYKVSRIFMGYLSNFVHTGNPNGLGLPTWIPINKGDKHYVMRIDVHTYLRPSQQRKQLFLWGRLHQYDDNE